MAGCQYATLTVGGGYLMIKSVSNTGGGNEIQFDTSAILRASVRR
jgi:hypothetical protein